MSSATFDPSLPADNSEVVACELRNQFIGLMNRCDTLQGQCDNSPAKPASVDALSLSISNPPTQAQVQAVADKVNELLAALQS